MKSSQKVLKKLSRLIAKAVLILVMSYSKSIAQVGQIQPIEKGEIAPLSGYVMSDKDYGDLLTMSQQFQDVTPELQSCLERGDRLEEVSVLPWVGAGLLLGVLGTIALMSAK